MQFIPFVKYTSCGNSFVIVDETEQSLLSEDDMSRFAFQATNISFGVGCDNLLIIQRCNELSLQSINRSRDYWIQPPQEEQAEFVFRMFEPSGEEALCCGNGLMCIASYLLDKHGISSASIMTEIPLATPKVIKIGTDQNRVGSWVNLGHPRLTPPELVNGEYAALVDPAIHEMQELVVKFRADDLKAYTTDNELRIRALLVFTGEPHLVIFPDSDFSAPEQADYIFAGSNQGVERRESFGSWLVEHIGNYMNNHMRHIFPAGINVNFARRLASGVIENRCFERGINRETLACGTGALAVAYIYSQMHKLNISEVDVLPHRCCWHDKKAKICIKQNSDGWQISSDPVMLFDAVYRFPRKKNSLPELLNKDHDEIVTEDRKLAV
ncbi:diaminopimelate epimerase [Psychromonas ingrahamii 37]|uniref:Diaminopimelate epimerase n=1 Tax=Psychromonas ingrahamii (strain DSM 17664 / CCUG 51855 / 37) TaxID=357804 RepID=A1SZV6_PSYIN|nr:diaminopimelate epimerase [Psychromonas ingrahamii]ABM05021.1 diaminopimelate epimerase [Psychromonas ingrahamii 37]